jgi:acyl-CoA synthetase (AMP-forming)/AMP-acid ligase II/NAD(P)-dependent dehydrogenase (short-subunit alcohol dehydrogenase family)
MMELSDRLRNLPPEKQKLLRRLLERDGVGASLLPIAARGEEAAAPLSHAQRSLWFMTQLAPESPFYNHPVAFRLIGPLDVEALEWACNEIVRRHAVLRTVFPVVDGLPLQEVLAASPVAIVRSDLADLPPAERVRRFEELADAEAQRPFDLAAGPLLRLALYRFAEQDHVLLRVVHHMVWDGWSSTVFDRELEALYAARLRGRSSPLAPLPLQYADFARWQRERLAEDLESQIAGWRQRLDGVPALALPTDRPRPDRQTFDGGAVFVELPAGLADRLEALSHDAGGTLFMTLLAVFQVLLSRYSGQERIVVGTPIANRVRREFEGVIGYFANVVVLATDLSGDPAFRELLARVKEVTAWAYAHQEIPFELLVEKLAIARDPSRNPIFQVMFALHNELAGPPQLADLTVEAVTLGRGTSHFDLEWHLWGDRERRQQEGIRGIITYNRDLYDEATVVRMLDSFKVLLAAAVEGPDRPLSALPGLPPAEQERLAAAARLAAAERSIWWHGRRWDLEEIEAAALAEPAVDACRVLRRQAGGAEELVAYVVWSHQPAAESLLERWREALAPSLPPLHVAGIDRLPLTADGWIDDAALARLGSAAADEPSAPPPLHLSDLFPGWRPGRGEEHTTRMAATAAIDADDDGEAPAGPPAYADGGPLVIPEGAPLTLGEALVRAAAAWPERGITLIGDAELSVHLSYPQLLARARSILTGLRSRGLRPRDSVVLHLELLGDHFACFWACVLGGIIPVTVARPASYDRKSSVLSKLWNTWELLARPPILTSDRLLPFLAGVPALYHDGGQGEGFTLLSVDELERHPPAGELYAAAPEDVVFHQLTSGSTGIPKCIQETHRGIVHHVHGARIFNGYTSDDVDLNWLPFDHVVPTLTCHLKDTYLGLRQVQVRTEVVLADPLRWLELIESYRVTHSWSPNFGFKLVCDALSRAPQRRFDLSSLVYVINAGEQITLPVVAEFLRRTAPFGFRPEAMQPSFGMAEVCTCMTFCNGFSLQRGAHRVAKSSLGGRLAEAAEEGPGTITFIDLGPPVPGVEIRIAGPDQQVLPERVIGRLQIRGAVVTPGYLRNDEANREAFVGDGWFDSGDLGFMDGGSLTLTGRHKEMIIIRGANFYCYEIEDVVNGLDGVEPTFSAAVAVEDAQTGTEGLAIFFVPRGPKLDPELIAAVRNAVARNFGVAPAFVVPLTRETFPKTTSGKIQRTQLKKGLAAGAFDGLLKEVDLATGNDNTVPRWFLEKIWRRKEPAVRARRSQDPADGATLVLLDAGGLGEALLARLENGEQGVRVTAGDAFARGSRESYTLDPRREEDFPALVAALQADGLAIARIVHLWPCDRQRAGGDAEAAQVFGSYSLLSLAQALAQVQGGARPVRLLTVTGGEPEHAPLAGLVRVLPQEWPWLDCRCIELPLEDLEADAQRLAAELAVLDKDREVAYRDGARCIRRLAPSEPQAGDELPFAPGGMVLISGGLGGIGFQLARHLAVARGSRLLLVGRTRLDGPDGEGAGEEETAEADAIALRTSRDERRERLAELRGLGGEVAYEAVDVADADGLREAVHRWEERWGTRLAGAIHLAGVFPSRLLAEETRESFAATLRPKVHGTLNLRRLLPPGAPFVVFGSNLAFFGGVATGAYAAAGNFVEALAEADRRRGGRSFCFAWSNWDEIGMSRGYLLKQALRERGYRMIGAAQGLSSWLAGMSQPAAVSWLIGLDPGRINVRRHVEGPAALLAAAHPAGSPALDAVNAASAAGAGQASPGTDLEKAIAAIWREVLQVDEIGVHQSFFDLGGQSLLLARVLFLLQQRLRRHLGMVELLRYPTIAALARHLGEEKAERRPTYDDARQRAHQQKRRQQALPAWRQRRA